MEISNDGDSVTSFESICFILSELWTNYKTEKTFVDFIQYNDIGLPLAFLLDSDLVDASDIAKNYVVETWNILLESLEIQEDTGWESLDDLFSYSKNNNEEK